MKRPIRCTTLLLLALLWSVPAQAQITFDADDARALYNQRYYATQTAYPSAASLSGLQTLIDQVSDDGSDDTARTYDFSPFAFEAEAFFLQFEFVPIDEAGGLPGADTPGFADADYVSVATVRSGGTTFMTYNYAGIEEGTAGGIYDYGNAFQGFVEVNTPPLREVALPLTLGTTWESETNDGTETTAGDVVGYGTVVMPDGRSEAALVMRRTVTDEVAPGIVDTTRYIDFFTTGFRRQFLSVAVDDDDAIVVTEIVDPESGEETELPNVFYQRGSDASARTELASGETGLVLDDFGLTVAFSEGSTSEGALFAYRIDAPSLNDTADDTATSGDGTTVTVNTFAQDGYYVIEADGLSGYTYAPCFSYDGLAGLSDPSKLVVLKRDDASQAWTPLNTTQDAEAQQVCADGLTSFSQFSLGSNEAFNALPVELAAFDARRDGSAVELTWQTASETNNAGFEIQRAVDGGGFAEIAFREGAGTTTEARQYRFIDEAVPFTAQRLAYRLQQVDGDGTTTYSNEVAVDLSLPQRFALLGSLPNPARGAATVRYALPEPAPVRLDIYDVLGRRVAVLVDEQQPAGPKEARLDAARLAPGVYFCRLEAGRHVAMQRLVVVR